MLDAKCTNGGGIAEPDTPNMPGVECINEGDPAREKSSVISDEDLPSPEERIVLYRELQQGDDSELETVLETGQNRASAPNLKPEGLPALPRTRTFEPRDRRSARHPLICEKEGVRRCIVEDFLAIKEVQ